MATTVIRRYATLLRTVELAGRSRSPEVDRECREFMQAHGRELLEYVQPPKVEEVEEGQGSFMWGVAFVLIMLYICAIMVGVQVGQGLQISKTNCEMVHPTIIGDC